MYLGQAQHIANRHSVSRTGSAYQGQAQRIEDNHIVLRKSTAYRGQAQSIRDRRGGLKTKNPIIPCPRDKTWPPYRWVQSECFVKREDICLNTFQLLFKFKTKERFNLFRQPILLLLAHYVRFPGSFHTKPFRYKSFRYKLKSIWYDIPRASTKTLKKSLDQNLTSRKIPGGGGHDKGSLGRGVLPRPSNPDPV